MKTEGKTNKILNHNNMNSHKIIRIKWWLFPWKMVSLRNSSPMRNDWTQSLYLWIKKTSLNLSSMNNNIKITKLFRLHQITLKRVEQSSKLQLRLTSKLLKKSNLLQVYNRMETILMRGMVRHFVIRSNQCLKRRKRMKWKEITKFLVQCLMRAKVKTNKYPPIQQ